MPARKTLVAFLLDRTGSMQSIKDDTIGGYNSYVDGLKGNILYSMIQFDSSSIDKVVTDVKPGDIPHLTKGTFRPRAMTPLIDASYETIKAMERKVAETRGNPKVVITIMTDGYENASRDWTTEQLQDLIKEKTAEGWEFNFLGASIDAYAQAKDMGIAAASTVSYDSLSPRATVANYAGLAARTSSFAAGRRDTMEITSGEKRLAGDKFDPNLKQAPKPKRRRPNAPKARDPRKGSLVGRIDL